MDLRLNLASTTYHISFCFHYFDLPFWPQAHQNSTAVWFQYPPLVINDLLSLSVIMASKRKSTSHRPHMAKQRQPTFGWPTRLTDVTDQRDYMLCPCILAALIPDCKSMSTAVLDVNFHIQL